LHAILIQFNLDLAELSSTSPIEKKWDAYWWLKYWKFVHECAIDLFFLKKTQIRKDTFPSPFIWEWAKQISNWNNPSDDYDLWNLNLIYLNQLELVKWIGNNK
jgi:hypothetical protein